MSKCPNPSCKAVDDFEAVQANIPNLNFRYLFIQCVSCETVVGVTEARYTPQVVQELASKLKLGKLD